MDILVPSDFERATQSLAGGVDSPVRAGVAVGGPPPAIAAARGSRVYDTSGRAYIDYVCAYGPVLLGHADPRIRAAVHQALAHGAVFGATHPDEIRLAERIQQHLPSMQRLRFVSTGTEACMSAIRVARSFTKREKFVRFAGNYHGHSDEMIFSAGASSNSAPKVDCGVTQAAVGDVHVLPYNDLTSLEKTLTLHGDEIAAVILEPVVGNMGLVEPLPGYLESVRAACDRFGVLLIFDEVITGFRLGLGGAQERFGVRPDLTCLGKTLGGGLPIAAFGGRADVMDQLAPAGSVFQGGTFSGNPVCVAAANAFLDALESDPLLHERLGRLARRLAAGLRDGLVGAQLTCPVVQCASIVDFMFRAGGPHQDYEQAREADPGRYARYYWAMLERGINLAPSQMEVMFLTASHTEADVDETVAAMHEALQAAAQRTDGVARSLKMKGSSHMRLTLASFLAGLVTAVSTAPIAASAATLQVELGLQKFPSVVHVSAGASAGIAPPTLTAHVGDSVIFVNADAESHHTATGLGTSGRATFPSDPRWTDAALKPSGTIGTGAWSTGDLAPGARSQPMRMSRPGTFLYGCFFDYGAGMRGVIVVEP